MTTGQRVEGLRIDIRRSPSIRLERLHLEFEQQGVDVGECLYERIPLILCDELRLESPIQTGHRATLDVAQLHTEPTTKRTDRLQATLLQVKLPAVFTRRLQHQTASETGWWS